MNEPPSPSIEVGDLHEISDADACALVDRHLGESPRWGPELIRWRLEHESQGDWKAEVGHWLRTAENHGYLQSLMVRIGRARRVHKNFAGKRHPNEKSHLDLMAELAPAMAAHYFIGTGWRFGAWEPASTGVRDVDVELVTPSGPRAILQVKAPDQPGVLSANKRKIIDGHSDERVLTAIEHGRDQLDGALQPSLIIVSAQRRFSLAADPGFVGVHLVGATTNVEGIILQARDDLGCFRCSAWRHIGAVVLLDHLRGATRFLYTCTVLLNPWADLRVRCEREWFPRARVRWGDGERLRWQAGPPDGPVYESTTIVTPWWRTLRSGSAST